MIQFNQTQARLQWQIGSESFAADPWSRVEPELSESALAASLRRGVPIGPIPIDPETRAKRKEQSDKTAAEAGVLRALKREAEEAKAETRSAKETLEATLSERDSLLVELRKLREAAATKDATIQKLEVSLREAHLAVDAATQAKAEAGESKVRAEVLEKQLIESRAMDTIPSPRSEHSDRLEPIKRGPGRPRKNF